MMGYAEYEDRGKKGNVASIKGKMNKYEIK